MAPKLKLDKYLEAGYVGVMVEHPITGKVQENLLELASYTQNGPGVRKFAQDVMAGTIADVHGDKDLTELARIAFAKLIEDKEEQFVTTILGKMDETIANAQREQLVNEWRAKLDELDNGGTQDAARELFGELTDVKAALADVEQRIAELRDEVSSALDISGTFDLSLIESGFYITADTKAKGSATKVARDYSADSYTKTRKMNGTTVLCNANILERDADGKPIKWAVSYQVQDGELKGTTWSGGGDSLNAADKIARSDAIDALNPGAVKQNNAPNWYDVPKVKHL